MTPSSSDADEQTDALLVLLQLLHIAIATRLLAVNDPNGQRYHAAMLNKLAATLDFARRTRRWLRTVTADHGMSCWR